MAEQSPAKKLWFFNSKEEYFFSIHRGDRMRPDIKQLLSQKASENILTRAKDCFEFFLKKYKHLVQRKNHIGKPNQIEADSIKLIKQFDFITRTKTKILQNIFIGSLVRGQYCLFYAINTSLYEMMSESVRYETFRFNLSAFDEEDIKMIESLIEYLERNRSGRRWVNAELADSSTQQPIEHSQVQNHYRDLRRYKIALQDVDAICDEMTATQRFDDKDIERFASIFAILEENNYLKSFEQESLTEYDVVFARRFIGDVQKFVDKNNIFENQIDKAFKVIHISKFLDTVKNIYDGRIHKGQEINMQM